MTTHSNILAWRIPWTEKLGKLLSIESQRIGHDWSDLARIPIFSLKCIALNLLNNNISSVEGKISVWVPDWDLMQIRHVHSNQDWGGKISMGLMCDGQFSYKCHQPK